MHIKTVTAEAFGPLRDETLQLSPGLTVVHGDNESAKSSWHAAIYAALCGRRRGKGANRLEDREFAERRRPWDGDSWRVRCEVELDDGRLMTLHHDLDGKVDCRAYDDRGRDVSNQIMYDGAPDGSRWLGLNRRTFAATACVNQAELLRVLDAADALQDDIQRAAASAGKDETAAAALAALKKYSSEHVGKDHPNSKRPLRQALAELHLARAALEAAQRAHDDYLLLVAEAEAAADAALSATAQREAAEAAEASAERLLDSLQGVLAARTAAGQAQAVAEEKQVKAAASEALRQRAHALSSALAGGERPSTTGDHALDQQVCRALGSWESAPEVPRLTGPSVEALRAELASLPEPPEGDIAVDPTIDRLRDSHVQASAVIERDARHYVDPPEIGDPTLSSALDVGPAALRSMAERLAEPESPLDPRLEQSLLAATKLRDETAAALTTAEQRETAALSDRSGEFTSPAARRPVGAGPLTAGGAGLLAAGFALFLLGEPIAATALVALGLVVTASALLVHRSEAAAVSTGLPAHADELDKARADLQTARSTSLSAERAYLDAQARVAAGRRAESLTAARRETAAEEARRLGLPPEPSRLLALADEVERTLVQREAFDRWHREHEADSRALAASAQRLASALTDRGHVGEGDVLATYAEYELACEHRAETARLAEQRPELERQLDVRTAAEEAGERALRLRRAAFGELIVAARSVGCVPAGELALPEHPGHPGSCAADCTGNTESTARLVADRLHAWLQRRAETMQDAERQRNDWHELDMLLAGRSLEELDAAVEEHLASAQTAQRAAQAANAEVAAQQRRLREATRTADTEAPSDARAAAVVLATRRERLELGSKRERELTAVASSHSGKVAEREQSIPSVAEAEERLEWAQREVQRVQSLGTVLNLATDYLEKAQDKTYSNLAPVLNSALEKWLPEVTSGRYRRVRVDPGTLAVQVESASGAIRRAELLSVGTAEQVYLLLRLALAEHLADKSTVSPLLLDDVTVQADPTRTRAILEMCKALADDGRQVVLSAQDPSVAAWAEQELTGDRHSLVRLTLPVAA